MRIHTSALSTNDIYDALRVAGVKATTLEYKGSRKRNRAFEIKLSGDSPFRQNGGSEYAATWDQWGIFLAALYAVDPDMIAAAYTKSCFPELSSSKAIFEYATGHRFDRLTLAQSHRRHNWRPNWDHTSSCDCGATQRWDHLNGVLTTIAARPFSPKQSASVEEKSKFDFDNLISDIDKLIDWQMTESPAAKVQFS